MFIRNRTKESIGPLTYEGFVYVIPPDTISTIYEPAGEYFTTHLFKVEEKDPEVAAKMKNQGIPPLIRVTKDDWDGATYVDVSRFQLDDSRLPDRKYVLLLAEKYGVKHDDIVKFQSDESIEKAEIVRAINALPVPNHIRFPESVSAKSSVDKKKKDEK